MIELRILLMKIVILMVVFSLLTIDLITNMTQFKNLQFNAGLSLHLEQIEIHGPQFSTLIVTQIL
jgi:hypothetical protein